MPIQILPQAPFDGQIFVDFHRIKWSYSAEDSTWNRIGVATDVPIARSEGNELGPTNGLFSARDKIMLDNLTDKAGGFGLLLKPGYYLTEDGAADNILTGDVGVVSETLKFDCTNINRVGDGFGTVPTVKVGLSRNFLESYQLEIVGPTGPKGDKGATGDDGRPGTGDGPQGDPGTDGADATAHKFSGIIYEELDEIFDTAVVNLRLDAPNGILEVTKAKMDVPGDDKAASRVAATPVVRDIEFLSTDLSKWQLIASTDDPAAVVDLNLIRLPKGWTGDSDSPVPVTPVKLSVAAQSVIDHFQTEANNIIEQWDKELNDWIIERDKAARDVLHNLATDLAECQFELPLEFCLGITPSDCNPTALGQPIGRVGNAALIVFIDETKTIYYPGNETYGETGTERYDSDLTTLETTIADNTGTAWVSTTLAVWKPSQDNHVIPQSRQPDGFTIVTINRPPTFAELINNFTTLQNQLTIVAGVGTEFDNIFLLVDNSGSMVTNTIEPGYSAFVAWLGNNASGNVIEQTFEDERWLRYVNEFLLSLAVTP